MKRKFATGEVDTGYFLIIKEDGKELIMPIAVHGIIRVTEVNSEYKIQWLQPLFSKEFLESDEIEAMEREAIRRTKEALGEFSD